MLTNRTKELSFLPNLPLFLMHTHSQTQYGDMAVSPVLCANRALFFILGTEVWGALQVDQLVLPHRPDVNVFGYQLLACPHGPVNHFGGRQVLGLQVNGDLPQVLQAFPAGPYGARAGHTMAFTLHHQRLSQYLDMRTWRFDSVHSLYQYKKNVFNSFRKNMFSFCPCFKTSKTQAMLLTCLPTSLLCRCISLLAWDPARFIFMGASANLEPMIKP